MLPTEMRLIDSDDGLVMVSSSMPGGSIDFHTQRKLRLHQTTSVSGREREGGREVTQRTDGDTVMCGEAAAARGVGVARRLHRLRRHLLRRADAQPQPAQPQRRRHRQQLLRRRVQRRRELRVLGAQLELLAHDVRRQPHLMGWG